MNLFVRFPGWNWLRLSRPTYSLYIPNVVRPVLSDCHSENLGLIWSWETTSTPSASRSLFKRFNPRNSISLLRHARFSTAATAIGAICVWLLRSNSSCMYKRPTAASSCATRSVATQSCLIISWNAIWRRNSCRRRLMRNSSRVVWMMEMSQMTQPLPYCCYRQRTSILTTRFEGPNLENYCKANSIKKLVLGSLDKLLLGGLST